MSLGTSILRRYLRVDSLRVIGALAVATVAVTAGALAAIWITEDGIGRKEAEADLALRTSFVKDRYDRVLETVSNTLGMLERIDQVRLLDRADCPPILGRIREAIPYLYNVLTVDNEGALVCSARPIPSGLPLNPAAPPYFSAFARTPGMTIGRPAASYIPGALIAGAGVPIVGPDGRRGAIVLSIDLPILSAIMERAFAEDQIDILVVTDEGDISAARDLGWVGNPAPPTVSDLLATVRGATSRIVAIENSEFFATTARLDRGFWTVVALTPRDVVESAVWARVVRQLLPTAALSVVVAICGLTVAFLVLFPLFRLTADLRSWSFRPGDRPVRPRGLRDLRRLGRALNAAIVSVRASEDRQADTRKRLETVFDALAEGVMVRRPDRTVIDANRSACTILGRSRDELLALTPENPIPWNPVDFDGRPIGKDQTPLAGALAESRDVNGRIIGIHRPDGELRWLSVNVRLVHDRTLGAKLAITSFSDITEERSAKSSTLAKSRFLAAASHDLRQPLHAQGLLLYTLEARIRDPEGLAILTGLKTAHASLAAMLGSLLDLSKIDAGAFPCEIVPTPVGPLLTEMAREFALLAGEKHLDLRTVPSSAWALADPVLLETILRNLLGNAVRYTKSGGILIGCRRVGPAVAICVVDTGIGIPEPDRERVFGEFERGTALVADGGLGLGLSIVRRLAALLGAKVTLRSEVGRGTEFRILVPRCAPQGSAAADPAAAAPVRMRFAVVDDSAEIRNALALDLGTRGQSVETFPDGNTLLDEDVGRFDGFILDLDLGAGDDGLRLADRLRRLDVPTGRIVIVTGDTRPATLQRLRASGIRFLLKPAPGGDILAMLAGQNRPAGQS